MIRGIGNPPLLRDDRVERPPPILLRIVHHQVHEDRHQEGENCGTVAHLRPVYAAVLDTLRWVFIAVALGGIAVTIYDRLDDRRQR